MITTKSLVDLNKNWRALQTFADQKRWPDRNDDKLVHAYKFYRSIHGLDGARIDLEKIDREFPHLYSAYSYRYDTSDFGVRWMVEACLFGKETPKQVSVRYSVHPESVEWYEYLFMNIRPHLPYPLLMFSSDKLLGKATDGSIVGDRDVQWKLVAYTWGVDMLLRWNNALEGFQADDWRKISNAARQAFAKRAWEAGMLLRPSQYNAIEIGDHLLRREQLSINEAFSHPTTASHALADGLIAGIRGILGTAPLTLTEPPVGTTLEYAEPRLLSR